MTTEDTDLSKNNVAVSQKCSYVDEARALPKDTAVHDQSIIDITALIIDCATNHLSVKEPFLSDGFNGGNEIRGRAELICEGNMNVTSGDAEPFNLHDAMTASQLMDKKMDCCEVPASLIAPWLYDDEETTSESTLDHERMIFPRPIPTGVCDVMSPLPWDDLTMQNTAFICVEMLVRFQSLLSGSSVGESTFTCLYAHSAVLGDMKTRLNVDASLSSLVESVQQMCLHDKRNHQRNDSSDDAIVSTAERTSAQWSVFACALALVELTESIRDIVLNADIYEEEDFSVMTHNLTFFTSTTNGADEEMIDTVEILASAMQMVKCLPPNQYSTIIQLVLGYQWNFLHILLSLSRLQGGIELQPTMESIQNVVQMAVQQLNDIHTLVSKCTESGAYECKEIRLILHRSFDSYVIRPLVGNIPIRKISFNPPATSILLLRTITSEMDTFVCSVLVRGTTLSRIQRMLDRACYANILCRSLLLLNLYFDEKVFGRYDLRDLILKDMHQLQHCPFITVEDDVLNYQELAAKGNVLAEHMATFLNRLAKPIYDSLKVRILNRNRQRGFIEMVLLPEWVSLQHEAQVVDVQMQQPHSDSNINSVVAQQTPSSFFTRYVLIIQIRSMDRYLEVGLELGLFRCIYCDISFALWYRDYVLSALHLQLSSMQQSKESNIIPHSVPTIEATRESKLKGVNKKKHISSKNSTHKNGKHTGIDPRLAIPQPPKRQPSLEELEDAHELKVIALRRNLCRKTIQYIAALLQSGVLKEQQFEFTTLERIFVKRFEVFNLIRQPPSLTYAHYLDGMNFSNVSFLDLIQAVSEGFQHCRSAIEQMLSDMTEQNLDPMYLSMNEAELRSLIKVCVGNTVYVQRLKQLVESAKVNSSEPVKAKASFDFESHKLFCIIKVEAL